MTSRNPSDDDTLSGAFRIVLNKFLQGEVDDCLPARVISYDRDSNRAQVQPLISVVDVEGNASSRGAIASVPVVSLGGGGFFVNFNLPEGSLGWIKANDRDMSLFLQSYSEARPNSRRLHSFSDGVFIPDIMTGYSIAAEDSGAMVIQNLNGSVKIALDDLGIRMVGPTVQIDSATAINFVSPTFTHNGVNVGSTHRHSQGNDSDGNVEQDVGVPF